MSHHDHGQHERAPSTGRSARTKIAFVIFLAVALFFLLTEHRAHFFGALPYLLILACPLLHLFHHGGHGGHGHGSDRPAEHQTRTTRES